MNYIEQLKKKLLNYMPKLTKEDDFNDFWTNRLSISKLEPLEARKIRRDYPNDFIEVFDIYYKGFDETIISGMLIVPIKKTNEKIPCLINYHGFTWYKGVPSSFAHFINIGVAVLSIDIRGQGGCTMDKGNYKSGMTNNLLTNGILDSQDFYYGRVYIDCIKAIDFVSTLENIDLKKIIIHGSSQGGGLAMAVAALDDRPWITIADVPSNSDLNKRVENGTGAFSSIQEFIKRNPYRYFDVLKTLSYIDTMNMAEKIKCPVFASVGLNDQICPPEQYMATYNRITSEKEILFYPHCGHNGGGDIHDEAKIKYIYERMNKSCY